MALQVETKNSIKECIKRKEYYNYPQMDEDVDYCFNWKQVFPGKISKEISRGSYATVFKAQYASKNCAIKKPHPHILSHEESIASYKAEIEIHSNLNHPSIVAFYDVYHVENHLPPLLIMERMWKSLHCVIKQKLLGIFPLQLKLQILLDVANGLSYLHSQNIVHRDLTLSNILLTTELNAKIADFGVAEKLGVTECNAKDCSVPGNSLYMPPETFASNPVCSIKIDIFSFGCEILCIMNEITPDKEDHFSKVAVAEKFLKAMPKNFFLLKELAATCLNHEPQNRPDIKSILEMLYIIAPLACTASSKRQKVQIRCSSGAKKADVNIATSTIRKWLKRSKENNGSKAINCHEILVCNNSVVNFFKHKKPKSNQQTWLHNLPTKFHHALIEVYSTYLETLSFQFPLQFFKSFTQPNNLRLNLNTLSNAFPSCYQSIPTVTRATYYVAFSQCSLRQTNKNENVVITLSEKQIISTNIVTATKPFTICMAPAEFNVFLLNSSDNHLYSDVHRSLGKRQNFEENQILYGKLEYDQLQFLTIKSLHMKPVLCNQSQVMVEESLLEESSIKKSTLRKAISNGEIIYAQKWLSSSVSEHLNVIKPNSIAHILILAFHPTCTLGILVVTIKTTFTQIQSKVLASLLIKFLRKFGFHSIIIIQSYKLCCYQHNLLILYLWLIITAYEILKNHGNMLLCIEAFYGNCFSVNGMQKRVWPAEYTCCTLYDHASNSSQACKFGFVKSLAIVYASKNDPQQKLMLSEAQWMSKLMFVICASLLAWFTSLHGEFYSSLVEIQSCYNDIDSDNFTEVLEHINCTTEVTTNLTLFANGDDELKIRFYAMQKQPSTSRRYAYTEVPLHIQQETMLCHSLSEASSNGLADYSMFNIRYFSHKQQQKSIYICTMAKQHNSKIECLDNYTKPVASSYSELLQFSSPVVRLHVTDDDYKTPQISSVIMNQRNIVAVGVESDNKQILHLHQSEQFCGKAFTHIACKQLETHTFSSSRLFKTPVDISSNHVNVDPAQSYCNPCTCMHMTTLHVCLNRQDKNVLNWYSFQLCIYNNTEPVLTLQAIAKHINHRLCISLCNGQAIFDALCKRLQHSFTSYYNNQKKMNFILIEIQMYDFSHALKPNVLERSCKVVVPCRNVLKLATCAFPCQHVRILCKQYSVSLVDNTTSHQCLESAVQLEHLPSVATDLVPGTCDEMTFTIEWLFLQNIFNVSAHLFHKRCTEFTLTLLLLENKWSSKPRSFIALSKSCSYEIPLASNYLCQEFPRVMPMQALHKNAYYSRNGLPGQGYGNADVSTRQYYFESRYKYLDVQYQLSVWYNIYSCRMQVLTVPHVINHAYKLCSILYNYQVYASFTVKTFQILQNNQYALFYCEFIVGSLNKYVSETLRGYPDVHNGLQINKQKKSNQFIKIPEILQIKRVYLFNNVSQLKMYGCVDHYTKSEVLHASLPVNQVFASIKSSTLKMDSLNITIEMEHKSQTAMTFENALSISTPCTTDQSTSSRQGRHLFSSTAVITITYKRSKILSGYFGRICTQWLMMKTLSGTSCSHNHMNAIVECTTNESLKNGLLGPSSRNFESRNDLIMHITGSNSTSNKILHSLPQDICVPCDISINYQGFQDTCYRGALIVKTTFNETRQRKNEHKSHNVVTALTEENQDQSYCTSNKHNSNNSTDDDQRKGKESNARKSEGRKRSRKKRDSRNDDDNDDNSNDNDDNDLDGGGGGHDERNTFKSYISSLLGGFLVLLFLLHHIWPCLPGSLLSQVTTKYQSNNVNVSSYSRLSDISNQSTCQLIKAELYGKKFHCNLFRLPFKAPLVEANANTTMQIFIQNNVHLSKDKRMNTGNSKPVTSLSPLCYITVLQLMPPINYKSYLLQVWNLGIECFQCDVTNVSIIHEDIQPKPVSLKAPRTQRMIPLLQQLYLHFTSLKKGRNKFYYNAARSKLKYEMSMLYASLLLEHEGDNINVCDVLCCITEVCKAIHELLKQIYHCYHIRHSLCDGALNNVVFRCSLSERYDTFAPSNTRTIQTKHLIEYTTQTGHTNESQATKGRNIVESSKCKCIFYKLEHNKNFNALMENDSHHGIERNSKNKLAKSINSHDKDFNLLRFLPLLQLLLLLFDFITVLKLLWPIFGPDTCSDVTQVYRKRLIRETSTNREMHQFFTTFELMHQVIVDAFPGKLCRNTKVLCITKHCKVLTCLNCVPLEAWNCIISYRTAASFSISEKLYLKIVSKQRLILIRNRLDTILCIHINSELKLALTDLQFGFSLDEFHIMNKIIMIHNLVVQDTNALNRFLLLRIRFHIESLIKHSMSGMCESFMQWMSNFSLHRFVHQSFGNYNYFRRNKPTLDYVIPSRDTLRSENEEIINCCFQDSATDILGSQSTVLHLACTIEIVATKRNRIDAFRPINIASGRTINYYPYHLHAANDDTWELVIGHGPLYVTSVSQELPNEHHEIIYANKSMYQLGLNKNLNAFVPPNEPDLGNDYNDDTVIVSYLKYQEFTLDNTL